MAVLHKIAIVCLAWLDLWYEWISRNKFPVEELLEFFPEGSGNLRADNFVPAWFLLENHHMTSFDDLKYGLKFLDRKVKSQTEGKLSFLKVGFQLILVHVYSVQARFWNTLQENVSSVMDQLDALLLVKDKFDRHVERRGSGYLTQIDESIGGNINTWKSFFLISLDCFVKFMFGCQFVRRKLGNCSRRCWQGRIGRTLLGTHWMGTTDSDSYSVYQVRWSRASNAESMTAQSMIIFEQNLSLKPQKWTSPYSIFNFNSIPILPEELWKFLLLINFSLNRYSESFGMRLSSVFRTWEKPCGGSSSKNLQIQKNSDGWLETWSHFNATLIQPGLPFPVTTNSLGTPWRTVSRNSPPLTEQRKMCCGPHRSLMQ